MTDSPARVRELSLHRRYFDLVAAGAKTVEVRVKYPRLVDLAAGDTIRFRANGTDETCDVRVRRVTEYPDFESLLGGACPSNINAERPGGAASFRRTLRRWGGRASRCSAWARAGPAGP
ncbi:ASCH domain-containing protein [Streptomyces lavendulae]|nr:ASCH domain-containing protein [Streptomyces lavendulae]